MGQGGTPYLSPQQPSPAQQGPLMEGWLSKRGKAINTTWRDRWFTVHQNGSLTYSHSKGGTDQAVELARSSRVMPFDHPQASGAEVTDMRRKRPFGFVIYTGSRDWYVDAGSREKRDIWLKALGDDIARLRH